MAVELAVVNCCVGARNINGVVVTFDVGVFVTAVTYAFDIEPNRKPPADGIDGAKLEEDGCEPNGKGPADAFVEDSTRV